MQKNRICIIDDNEAVCQSLKFLFDSFYNLKVETFQNPLLFLKKNISDWRGCILIDLFMPSLNGIDLLKKLKTKQCAMKIIIISGHANNDAANQSLAAGAAAFISKPFKIDELLATINQLLQLTPYPILDSAIESIPTIHHPEH